MSENNIVTFTDNVNGGPIGGERMVFDWDKAAEIIRDTQPDWADAGLIEDLGNTRGRIWSNGKPKLNDYTYLASTWAVPTLFMPDREGIPCYRMEHEVPRWDAHTKWPKSAIRIVTGKDKE